jgi:hypothetical protein
VPATRALIKPSLLGDPTNFPPETVRRRFFTMGPIPPAATRAQPQMMKDPAEAARILPPRARNRMWEHFKAGD